MNSKFDVFITQTIVPNTNSNDDIYTKLKPFFGKLENFPEVNFNCIYKTQFLKNRSIYSKAAPVEMFLGTLIHVGGFFGPFGLKIFDHKPSHFRLSVISFPPFIKPTENWPRKRKHPGFNWITVDTASSNDLYWWKTDLS